MVGDGLSAVQTTLALQPQVLFFDIRMPGQSGLDAAMELVEHWPDSGVTFPLLVFVTAYQQYAVHAFEAQAIDYLVKPVQIHRLAQTINRLKQALAARPQPSLALEAAMQQLRNLLHWQTGIEATPSTLPNSISHKNNAAPNADHGSFLEIIQATRGNQLQFIRLAEVLYIEAADKYLRVVTPQQEALIRTSLKELLPQLDPAQFWRIHRGTVVRATAIDHARRNEAGRWHVHLAGRPETLAVSRLYAHLFRSM